MECSGSVGIRSRSAVQSIRFVLVAVAVASMLWALAHLTFGSSSALTWPKFVPSDSSPRELPPRAVSDPILKVRSEEPTVLVLVGSCSTERGQLV